MWNDQKVSQYWEISQSNLSTDDVAEELKPVWLCVIYNDLGPNKRKLQSQTSLTLHRHVDPDVHRTCWQCYCIWVARDISINMSMQGQGGLTLQFPFIRTEIVVYNTEPNRLQPFSYAISGQISLADFSTPTYLMMIPHSNWDSKTSN